MKKISLICFSLILPAVFVSVALSFLGHEYTPDWKIELDQYLAYKSKLLASTLDIERVYHANQPWNFKPDMSSVAYGESGIFRTDYGYTNHQADYLLKWQFPISDTGGGESRIPIPYPPEEVWCILLKQKPNHENIPIESKDNFVVFVALYKELYNSDWVIHESKYDFSSSSLENTLSTIGCKLDPR